ncbi:MarR family winged helix-turn-helix transcriptional regulator [Hydrogenophaga pseudoflava]|uniref:MarR family winged helix-turn-helix transcriptional regulator n=1 Tax=Hydrogenophaga pseudoflava TaxID=47421 RepID=UPI0027E52FEC|nr:MarR family winged helix-turn-helix transcriptional regulator [Hydrogenophaga pseudoflava]MDQ7744709.1 MarR family winged helix-turn-helix transcriptional regulator [Hydrogenophaga pseudoflava]
MPPVRPPRLIFLLNAAQRRLQQLVAAEQLRLAHESEHAPSPAQGGLLFVLQNGDGRTMGEVSQELDLAPSATTGLVQRTEALGWVRRAACPQDARTQRVWLLPAGREQLPLLRSAVQRINRRLTNGFTPDELATVARWLQHVQQTTQESDEP